MQHIITGKLYFTSLDSRFNPCSKQTAKHQMEMYKTDKEEVCVISVYTGNFSYGIGQKVEVAPTIELKENFSLKNIIKNSFFNTYMKNRTF